MVTYLLESIFRSTKSVRSYDVGCSVSLPKCHMMFSCFDATIEGVMPVLMQFHLFGEEISFIFKYHGRVNARHHFRKKFGCIHCTDMQI